MKKFILLFYCFFPLTIVAQPNCNVFLWQGDTLQYEACKLSEKFNDYYQFDMKGIAILDSCIEICPYYAFAHYEIAVVYLKAGNFAKWDEYINNAVQYDPKEYLGSRASCRAKFFADYEGAIKDIDKLDSLVEYDIGHIHDGSYHLDAYKAICYKALGDYEKAIELFEEHIDKRPDYIGFYDYIHLGVSYMNLNKYEEAVDCFDSQSKINNLAENQYYLALCYKAMSREKESLSSLNESKSLYLKERRMLDPYHTMEDQIFLTQIDDEINSASKIKESP